MFTEEVGNFYETVAPPTKYPEDLGNLEFVQSLRNEAAEKLVISEVLFKITITAKHKMFCAAM